MAQPGERSAPLGALTATTLLVGANAMAILFGVSARMNWTIWDDPSLAAALALIIPVLLVVGGVQYWLWVADGRHHAIARDQLVETRAMHRIRTFLIVLYIVVSVLAIPLAGMLTSRS